MLKHWSVGCYLALIPSVGLSQDTGHVPPDAVVGYKIFQTRCFVCHGRDGKGDGPAATGLGANPRNFTDPTWQKSVSDDRMKQVIKGGGAAVDENPAMTPNPDLTPDQVDSIVKYIRSLAK
jgi:mono/diheme cytochrome c family protein